MNWDSFQQNSTNIDQTYREFRIKEEALLLEAANMRVANGIFHASSAAPLDETKNTAMFFSVKHGETTLVGSGYTVNATMAGASTITDTVLGTQIQVNDAINDSYCIVKSNSESSYEDVTYRVRLVIKSIPIANSTIGIVFEGATNGYVVRNGLFRVNLFTGALHMNFNGQQSVNEIVPNMSSSLGDAIEISFTRRKATFFATFKNLTTGLVYRTVARPDADNRNNFFRTNIYPAFMLMAGTYLVTETCMYTKAVNPDIVLVGDSIANGYNGTNKWSETISGRITTVSGLRCASFAKSANALTDMLTAAQNELPIIKPKNIIVMAGHNDTLFGATFEVQKTNYTALVDYLKTLPNTKIYLCKIIPSAWVNITGINQWIVDTYGNDPSIKIINLYDTTRLYNEADGSKRDVQYYLDTAHLRSTGNIIVGDYLNTIIPTLNLNR